MKDKATHIALVDDTKLVPVDPMDLDKVGVLILWDEIFSLGLILSQVHRDNFVLRRIEIGFDV